MEKDGTVASVKTETVRFQSTLSHGERLKMMQLITVILTFQSTLSHGERLN